MTATATAKVAVVNAPTLRLPTAAVKAFAVANEGKEAALKAPATAIATMAAAAAVVPAIASPRRPSVAVATPRRRTVEKDHDCRAAMALPGAMGGACTPPHAISEAKSRLCVASPLRRAMGGGQRGGGPRSPIAIGSPMAHERRGHRHGAQSTPRSVPGVPLAESPLNMRTRRRPSSGCGTPRNPPSGCLPGRCGPAIHNQE